MKEYEIKCAVDRMDQFQKLELYMDYFIRMISLKHDFEIYDLRNKMYINGGLGSPDKKFGNLGFHFLWKEIKILSFESFCSEENFIINDAGNNWKEKGYTAQQWINLFGIYDHYRKFVIQ